ncbi:MAG TPA: ABC transporter transmembrane domain-containing protein, partial [Chthonomonadales bacterium]|nr:ABC transporter transmembrane domain-containing protein [Chthonomonadales bacterium]
MMMRGPMPGPTRPVNKATLRRIARTFAPYKMQVALTCCAVIASAALGLLSPFFLRIIVNQGLLGRNLAIVTKYTLLTLFATIGSTLLGLAYGYLSTVVGQRIMRDLRNSLYNHLQGMSLRFFTNTRTGEIQSRLISDVGGVQSVLSDTASTILSNVTTVLSTLVVMVIMDWRLTLLSVGILPLFAGIGSKVGGYARGIRSEIQKQMADLNATMQETLSVSGVLLTKTTGRRALALSHFQQENQSLTDTTVK